MKAAEPFSTFVAYNQAIFPLQFALLLLAAVLVLLAWRGGKGGVRPVWAGLALLWAWCGAVFFIAFYGRQGPAPMIFGAFFLAQAVLFAVAAARGQGQALAVRRDLRGVMGTVLIFAALLVYPLLATALGQRYPAQPTFGAPCPLTIFTFGMLVLFTGRVPGYLLIVPAGWAILGFTPILRWGIYEDIMLPLAALAGLWLILSHNRRLGSGAPPTSVGETPAPMEGTGRLH